MMWAFLTDRTLTRRWTMKFLVGMTALYAFDGVVWTAVSMSKDGSSALLWGVGATAFLVGSILFGIAAYNKSKAG